jgi:ABC-type phosphate/phosphonate transport system, periplasmic component
MNSSIRSARPAIAVGLLLLGGCASAPTVPPAARMELAPTGKLRVGLILSNQVLVTKDPTSGELRGVTISLGKALAQRLDVPLEAVAYANPAALVKSFGNSEWDIAFLACRSGACQGGRFFAALTWRSTTPTL